MGLDLEQLAEANRSQRKEWHGEHDDWSGADWSNAMGGEVGEVVEALLELVKHQGLAADTVKKLRRHESGYADDKGRKTEKLVSDLANELADVVCYASLLSEFYGIDLGEAIKKKFNEVSEKRGFPHRLGENGFHYAD